MRRRSFLGGRLLVALAVAALAVITYYGSCEANPVTGETQRVALSVEQEVALGLQAAGQLQSRHGGLHPDREARRRLETIGRRIENQSGVRKSPFTFEFYLLADRETINAFALPGGHVFITAALYERLRTDGQLAGVLGHEMGHVVARHGAEHVAKARLTEGLTGAAVLATYDPSDPGSAGSAAVIALVGQLVNLRYGRKDELESDELGLRFMAEAGYDPRALIAVMEVLEEAGRGRQRPPEFFSTHPSSEDRIDRIRAAIAAAFPDGVPPGLIP
jgi:predicted Zn-dependent protease